MKKLTFIMLLVILVLTLQVSLVYSAGNFYVGLLAYNNTEGLTCCGEDIDGTTCMTECGIIFEIRVAGLNGSSQAKNLSNVQLTLAEAVTIPTGRVTNPLTFIFNGWPGEVNVSVIVSSKYGDATNKQFDMFQHTFESIGPTDFYYSSKVNSQVFPSRSQLSIVFRYFCDAHPGSSCWDCLEHNDTDPCPPTGPSPSSPSITVPGCSVDNPNNCSVNVTTVPSEMTTLPDGLTTEYSEIVTQSNEVTSASSEMTTTGNGNQEAITTETTLKETTSDTAMTTIPQTYLDSNSNSSRHSSTTPLIETTTLQSNVAMNSQDFTTSSEYGSPNSSTETVNSSKTLGIISTSSAKQNIDIVTNTTASANISKTTNNKVSTTVTMKDERTARTSPVTMTTTPSEVVTKIDDGPTYWPAIVGGVLGGVAFMSAIGFCIYYRRQKKLRKRQEIYNVNPKVLRNFEEYEENGTSGRADVPLETEQY